MNYYLDTVSARKISKYFYTANIKENCFVSIHVISELITDLNNDNFFFKKNTLKNIFENNIIIDWEQPHKKQFESFGFYNVKYNLNKDNVLFFYEKMIHANSLNDFFISIDKYTQEYEIIQKYDNAFEAYFRKEMDVKINDFKSEFSYDQSVNICDQMIMYLKNTEEGYMNFLAAICIKMAEDLYNSEINMYEQRSVEEIINSYNGQIDTFLIVSGIYVFTKVPRKQQLARNDFNDLYHLMYINNKTIVSDDSLFDKYMREVFPENIISYDCFIEKVGLSNIINSQTII